MKALLQGGMRRVMARAQALSTHPWLQRFGGSTRQRRLWRLSRQGAARGAAIGVCCGLLFPVAQIPVAVAAGVILRAHIPLCAVSTLVTNPVTFPPIYYGAYRLGVRLTGAPPTEVTQQQLEPAERNPQGWLQLWWERLSSLGRPLIVGLGVLATVGGTLAYLVADRVWVLVVATRRRTRTE